MTSLKFRILSCFFIGSTFLIFFPALWFSGEELFYWHVKDELAKEKPAETEIIAYFSVLKQELIKKLDSLIDSSLQITDSFNGCIALHGYCVHILDKQIIHDANMKIARQKNDSLTMITLKCDYSKEAQTMAAFHKKLKNQNIPFVFLLAPHKVSKYQPLLPPGFKDFSNENSDNYLQILAENNVPYIDLRDIFKNDPESHDRMFYKMDAHWTSEYGFHAFCQLAEYLREHGIEIPQEITDRNAYSVTFRSDLWKNDLGKRLGKNIGNPTLFLVPERKPNIRIGTPGHDFHFVGTYSVPLKTHPSDTVFINEDSPNRKKILFFSDSFGDAFVGFLLLSCNHLEWCRMNKFSGNLWERIQEVQPDYVIGLFTARDTYGYCRKFGIVLE